MSNAIFPATNGLGFTVVRQSEMRTIIQTSPSLVEQRIQQAQQPVYHWTLIYEWLWNDQPAIANTKPYAPWSDYDELTGFWLARAGQYDSFLFRDTSQRAMGQVAYYGPGITVSEVAKPPAKPNDPPASSGTANTSGCVGYRPASLQLIDGGDGYWYSPIQIWRGGQFWEDVSDIDGALYVYANGALQSTSSYVFVAGVVTPNFSTSALTIRWNSSPGGGGSTTWAADTAYLFNNQVIDSDGHTQQVVGGRSGSSTPSWNHSGGTTSDGSLVWTDRGAVAGSWAPDTAELLGTQIIDGDNHIQQVIGGVSGSLAPTWNDTGGTTDDDSLVWQDEGAAGDTWTPSTPEILGNQIYDAAGHVQQVVGGRSMPSNITHPHPAWNDSGGTTLDFTLVWTDQGTGSGPPAWQQYHCYSIDDEILDPSGHIQKVTAINGATTGAAEPVWNDTGGLTCDGSVQWEDLGGTGGATTWLASSCYAVGAKILDSNSHVQRVSGISDATTGGTVPVWNDTGGFTKDNNVMWQDEGVNVTTWQEEVCYPVGAAVFDIAGHLQQVTAISGAMSGSTTPDWNDTGGTTCDGTVMWQDEGSGPAPIEGVVTAQFNYFYRVRFESDQQDWEQFMQELWTIGGEEAKQGTGYLKLRSVRGHPLPPGCSLVPVVTTDGFGWVFTGTLMGSGGSGGGGSSVLFADNEVPADSGDHQHFTLIHTPNPAASTIGVLEGTNYASQVLLQGVDFTLSGASISLTNAINVSGGATFNLRFWYRYTS